LEELAPFKKSAKPCCSLDNLVTFPQVELSLTVSFDHNIVDGAPASRFMNQLIETIKNGNLLHTDVDTKL
jgi:hypothetical protein